MHSGPRPNALVPRPQLFVSASVLSYPCALVLAACSQCLPRLRFSVSSSSLVTATVKASSKWISSLLLLTGDSQNPLTYTATGTSLTALGEAQEFELGSTLRSLYLDPASSSAITGLASNTALFNQNDFAARADAGGEGGVIFDSAIVRELLKGSINARRRSGRASFRRQAPTTSLWPTGRRSSRL